MQSQMPESMLVSLNDYLDALVTAENRKSHGKKLVGQIRHGQQLTLNHNQEAIKPFAQMMQNLGAAYINDFQRATECNFPRLKVEIHDLWSVHSFERDYNPLHDHLTSTTMGMSFAAWTKIPEAISKNAHLDIASSGLEEPSGLTDGTISFHFGDCSARDFERLRPAHSLRIRPTPGKIMLFPSWLQHVFYPFEGDGERRTVAGNLNVWSLREVGN